MRWSAYLARVSSNFEARLDKLKQQREHLDDDPLVIFAYLTYGTTHQLWLKGRVLEASDIQPVSAKDSRWRNLRNTLKRFASDEISGASLKAMFRSQSWELLSDEEGYFEHWLMLDASCEAKVHQVNLELLSPIRKEQTHLNFFASVIVPENTAKFGIISDIDDTILKSDAISKRKAAQKILFGNAFTREVFAGVAEFYQALHQDLNPVFYVSSSPWNVYDVLLQFLELNNIPMGPLLLRDWGLSAEELLPTQHSKHKLSTIRQILTTYPDLAFLLLGDSGQEDPEIYQQIIYEFPKQILGAYIRDVTGLARKESIEIIARDIANSGCFMQLDSSSKRMMEDARARGLIS
jgi:phosphatidate phosphatase APP1